MSVQARVAIERADRLRRGARRATSRSSASRPTSSSAPRPRCSAAARPRSAPSPTPRSARSASACPVRCRWSTRTAVALHGPDRARAELRHRAAGAASPARTTSIRTCRRTSRSASTTSRCASAATSTSRSTARPTGSASPACTWRRTPASRCTSAARPAGSTARPTRCSTTTGPASRWSRSSPSPTSARPRSPRRTSPSCASCCRRSASPRPGWSRASCAATRTSRCARAAPRVRHPYRDQEPQLAALGRARGPLRDRPAGRGARRRWPDRPGDPALRRGLGHHRVRTQQGRGDRLPLLPGARPAPARR